MYSEWLYDIKHCHIIYWLYGKSIFSESRCTYNMMILLEVFKQVFVHTQGSDVWQASMFEHWLVEGCMYIYIYIYIYSNSSDIIWLMWHTYICNTCLCTKKLLIWKTTNLLYDYVKCVGCQSFVWKSYVHL